MNTIKRISRLWAMVLMAAANLPIAPSAKAVLVTYELDGTIYGDEFFNYGDLHVVGDPATLRFTYDTDSLGLRNISGDGLALSVLASGVIALNASEVLRFSDIAFWENAGVLALGLAGFGEVLPADGSMGTTLYDICCFAPDGTVVNQKVALEVGRALGGVSYTVYLSAGYARASYGIRWSTLRPVPELSTSGLSAVLAVLLCRRRRRGRS